MTNRDITTIETIFEKLKPAVAQEINVYNFDGEVWKVDIELEDRQKRVSFFWEMKIDIRARLYHLNVPAGWVTNYPVLETIALEIASALSLVEVNDFIAKKFSFMKDSAVKSEMFMYPTFEQAAQLTIETRDSSYGYIDIILDNNVQQIYVRDFEFKKVSDAQRDFIKALVVVFKDLDRLGYIVFDGDIEIYDWMIWEEEL